MSLFLDKLSHPLGDFWENCGIKIVVVFLVFFHTKDGAQKHVLQRMCICLVLLSLNGVQDTVNLDTMQYSLTVPP